MNQAKVDVAEGKMKGEMGKNKQRQGLNLKNAAKVDAEREIMCRGSSSELRAI